jgi:class 3 adenylate cyclase
VSSGLLGGRSSKWDRPRGGDNTIRVGTHSGEVAPTAEHVRGVAVHAAARILDKARADEVLVSGIIRDLALCRTGIRATGAVPPQGLEREHDLFAAASSTG